MSQDDENIRRGTFRRPVPTTTDVEEAGQFERDLMKSAVGRPVLKKSSPEEVEAVKAASYFLMKMRSSRRTSRLTDEMIWHRRVRSSGASTT